MPFLHDHRGPQRRWESFDTGPESSEAVAREFLGALYDLFVENRGLVMTLWAADALTDEELAETGIVDIDRAIAVLGQLGGKGSSTCWGSTPTTRTWPPARPWRWSPGMAAFGATFFGGTRPPRDVIVEELAQATLHGFLHRGP